MAVSTLGILRYPFGMKLLSDIEVHERLAAARKVMGEGAAETVRGDTALKAARQVLTGLGLALLLAGEQESDRLDGVPTDRGES